MREANSSVDAGDGKLRAVDVLLLPYVIIRMLGKSFVDISSEHFTQWLTKSKCGKYLRSPSSIYQRPTLGQTLITWRISNSSSSERTLQTMTPPTKSLH